MSFISEISIYEYTKPVLGTERFANLGPNSSLQRITDKSIIKKVSCDLVTEIWYRNDTSLQYHDRVPAGLGFNARPLSSPRTYSESTN